MTDHSADAPDKIALCLDEWYVGPRVHRNCTTVSMDQKDLTKPCKLLAEELKFEQEPFNNIDSQMCAL